MSWFNRFRSRPKTLPSDPADATPEFAPPKPEAVAPKYEAEENLAPAAEPVEPLSDCWFDQEEIEALKTIDNEATLTKAISELHPNAGREEVLFRYTLSRAVYFQEFDLPVLPGTAARVMQLGRTASTAVQDYVQVIQSDPALASAVVRLSNSTVFSGISACSTLDQSIVRIGVAEVEKIAMLHTFNARLFRVKGQERRIEALVRHGIEVAFGAQLLAQDLKAPAAEAFLGGLFHDAGKLVLLQIIGQVQSKLKWQAPDVLIESAFDAFHPQVGEVLCRAWELPEAIAAAVRWHHDIERVATDELRRCVYLGNQLAYALDVPSEGDDGAWVDGDPILEPAGLSLERCMALRDRLREDLESILGGATDRQPVTQPS